MSGTSGIKEEPTSIYSLNNVSMLVSPRLTMQLMLNKLPHIMEVDSRAAFLLISEPTFHCLWPVIRPPILPEVAKLKTWTGQLRLCGRKDATVELAKKLRHLPHPVMEGSGTSLLG